ncbi:MAG: pilus (MSHA type) biogenesis protein MshL [Thiobacillaceae bacterium]
MNKTLVLVALILSGCAGRYGEHLGTEGSKAMNSELKPVAQPAAKSAPPAALPATAPPVPAALPAPKPMASEPRFNLTVNNAKASEVFMGMVTGTPYSMLVHPDVTGRLTLNLKNVTVPEAMEAVRALYGYDYEVQGTRIIVPSPAPQVRVYHLDALTMQRKGTSDMRVVSGSASLSNGSGPTPGSTSVSKSLETSTVQTSFDSKYWDEVAASLKALVGDAGNVVVSPQSGVIIVKSTPSNFRMVEKFLHESELTITRQVMLEAKILQVQLNDGYQSGVNWATLQSDARLSIGVNGLNPTGLTPVNPGSTVSNMLTGAIPGLTGPVLGLAFNDGNFGTIINLIQNQGAVHVLSSPRIATINNQKAVLKVGTDDFFVTEITGGTVATPTTAATPPNVVVQPFFSGIALDVTPEIDDTDNITLHVRPSVSNVKEVDKTINLGSLGSFILPLASSTISETDSVVRLKDGKIVAIGGLMSQTFNDNKNRIPLLGEIPLLGQLFGNTSQSTQKNELVVLIKATIIHDSEDWSQDLDDTRRRFKGYNLGEGSP